MAKPKKQHQQPDYGRMLENLPIAIIRCDSNGMIVYANSLAQRLLGKEVVGNTADNIYGSKIAQSSFSLQSIKSSLKESPYRQLTNVTVPIKLPNSVSQDMLCSFVLDDTTDTIDGMIVPGVIELHQALARIAESLNKRVNQLEETLRVITNEARVLCKADRAYIKLHDPARNVLAFKALSTRNSREKLSEESSSLNRGMTGHVFHTKQFYRSGNVMKEPPRMYYSIFPNTVSKAVAPLLYQNETETICFGVLAIDGKHENQFGVETEEILKILAKHASIAVAQVKLFDEVRVIYQEILESIHQNQEIIDVRNILHDGKNMVRDVVYEVQAIQEELSETAFGKRKARQIETKLDSLRALNDLMQELLEHWREEISDSAVKEDCVDLYFLALRVINLIPLAGAPINVKVHSEGGCQYQVFAKSTKVLLILYNLLTNAVTAIKQSGISGEITIRLTPTPKNPKFCRMQVVDNGPGLERSVLRLIREGEMLSKTGGTGLGLLAVREAVNELDGIFSIDSNFGEGTRITIDLPGRSVEETK